jgi:MFS transporter, DHA2 family, methylenomycin A resistance protein
VGEPRTVIGGALLHVPHPHRQPAREGAEVSPGAVLALSCVVLFLIGVNTTAVNTALNAIAGDLGMGAGELGWTVGIYMLAAAAFVVLGGRLGDMLGERTMLIAGMVVFALAAALVAAADAAWTAILGRFLQGFGAACLMPATMAILRIAYPPERQGFALGIWGAVGGVAFAVGPLIGGALTDAVSWRWVWWLTVIAGAATGMAAAAILRGLPAPGERPRLDLWGVALLPIGLFALILAIQQGPAWGWGSARTIAAFALSALSLVALVVIESRRLKPLLHLSLLREPALNAANLGTFANAIFLIGFLYFANVYMQAVVTLDWSAMTASVALLPYGFCVFVASMAIGRICDRVGFRWPIAVGLVLMGVGGLLLGGLDAHSGFGDLWWRSVIVGLGVGITFSAPSAAGMRAVRDDQAGEAAGIVNVVRYLGAALAISIGTAVFTSVGSDRLNERLDRVGVAELEREQLDKSLTGAPEHVRATERTLDASDRAAFRAGAGEGVADGFSTVIKGMGIFALLAALGWVALLRPRRGAPG